MACANQLEEKELAIHQMRSEHDATLAYIARQLTLLQANMLKEQQKLEAMLAEKSDALQAMSLENERLKKINKRLETSASSASTSQESSPKGSFSVKPVTSVEVPPRSPQKPPVPSREGINRLLQQQQLLPPPPPPPVRSTSLGGLQRADSGRESDLTDAEPTAVAAPKAKSCLSHDEGFSSSHEDSTGGNGGTRASRINHRNVQKPSDIKLRSKSRLATSSPPQLDVLEEQSSSSTSSVTTVTYWTGSFL